MKILYLDCVGGISGDMTLGALLDAGVDARELIQQLRLLPLTGYEIKITEETKGCWRGTRVRISLNVPDQPHRHLSDVLKLIAVAPLPAPVKEMSGRVFQRLAAAEARVHGITPEDVHFHEVGAVDSILDIIGSCLAFYLLRVQKIYCSPLPVGHGTIRCAHGILPVPAPATAELTRGLPLRSVDVEGELVTPTGAAIASTLAEHFGPLPSMHIDQIGYGLGSRDYDLPNFLRVFVGQISEKKCSASAQLSWEEILVLETDIDDMNPEFFPYVDDVLRQAGAMDVFFLPLIMKKGRPGTRLTVLCRPGSEGTLLPIIFRETTTLGVRMRLEQRQTLNRRILQVQTKWGKVGVKVSYFVEHEPLQVKPEFEDCRRLAMESGRTLAEIYHAVQQAALQMLVKP